MLQKFYSLNCIEIKQFTLMKHRYKKLFKLLQDNFIPKVRHFNIQGNVTCSVDPIHISINHIERKLNEQAGILAVGLQCVSLQFRFRFVVEELTVT